MKCSICKENIAVIFITKIVNGEKQPIGLCIPCAQKQPSGGDEVLPCHFLSYRFLQNEDHIKAGDVKKFSDIVP
jgi:protein-arginine kinase activator protein McsA